MTSWRDFHFSASFPPVCVTITSMIGTSLSGHTYHGPSVCVYVHSFNYFNKMLPKPLTRRQCSSSNVYVTVKILCIMTPDMWECGLTPCDTCDNILMLMFMLIYILLFRKSVASWVSSKCIGILPSK